MADRTHARRGRRSSVYTAWLAIRSRGEVCRRWRCLPNFYRDVGPRPSWAHLVIRDDTSRPFEPGNACWQVAKWHRSPRAAVSRAAVLYLLQRWKVYV
jgi:hypothetical protein